MKILSVLQLALTLKCINGLSYIKCLLTRISISKNLFVLEMEQGNDVFIPKDLTQSRLPMSMRYYDAILAVVQEGISDEVRSLFVMRSLVAFDVHR